MADHRSNRERQQAARQAADEEAAERIHAEAIAAFSESSVKDIYECPTCSALVVDRDRHVRWHKWLDAVSQKANKRFVGSTVYR